MTFTKNRRPARKPASPPTGAATSPKPALRKPRKKAAAKPVRKPVDRAAVPNIENTGREASYLDQLIRQETPVAVVLRNGETWEGYIRYYDRDVFSLGPLDGGPKIFLRKDSVRYLYEME